MDLLIEILNFVNDNYLKFAIGLILILMAIIGYYAEKTNFGNKLKIDKKNEQTNDDEVNLNNVRINDFLDKEQITDQKTDAIQKQPEIQNENVLTKNNINIENDNKEVSMPQSPNGIDESSKQNETLVQSKNDSEESIDDEFEKILSKDDSAIKKDLIMDINNMKVDPLEKDDSATNDALVKLNSSIDLPKIDDLKSDNDIWKF